MMTLRRLWRPRNALALASASARRTPSADNTTQVISTLGCSSTRRSTVAPQPISMSSECAPRNSTRRSWSNETPNMIRDSSTRAPDFPRRRALGEHLVEVGALLEGVHAGPEAVIRIGVQLALLDEPAERLLHQFFAVLHVIEDAVLEDEEATVD